MPRSRPTAGHLLRRFTLGSGPLKRTSDRLQFLARVLLVVSFVTAIPISLAVVSAAYTQARTQALAQAADRHPVTARLLDAVPAPAEEAQNSITADREWATAVWTDPAGIEHRASFPCPCPPKRRPA